MGSLGLDLTKRLLSLCILRDTARVLDIGCGDGAAVDYLRGTLGVEAWGLDMKAKSGVSEQILSGRAEALPFQDAFFDALLFECSLSVIACPDAALQEAARVLTPAGVVYIADLYSPQETAQYAGLPWRVERWPALVSRFTAAGFRVCSFEDHSAELRSWWAGLLFKGTMDSADCRAAVAPLPRGFKAGYFLAVLERERFTPESLLEYQRERRTRQERSAREQSPFYREQTGGFVDAHTIAGQGERMLCVPLGDVARIRTVQTSGTSGAPKRICFTEGDMERTVSFFSQGMRPLVQEGGTCVVMLSNDTPGSVADLLRRGLAQNGVKCIIHGPIQGLDAAAVGKGAQCYVGLPAELFWLCRCAPQLRPQTVLLSGDYVSMSITKVLEAEWGCRVFTHYGLTETCYGLAVQCCAQEGQHIRLDDYIVEIIDPLTGAELPLGQEGEIVVSSLSSEAMPLLRYRSGDIGSLITDPCACGSRLPRLGKVRGRFEYLKHRINIHLLDDLLFALPGIRAYQALLERERLCLTLEGGAADAVVLSKRLGIKVNVEYGVVFPYRGKRKLLLWPL
ncbi:DVU_1553 family AMP-dependent CoA ligase [Breznakiellaceae bacterium SP9]